MKLETLHVYDKQGKEGKQEKQGKGSLLKKKHTDDDDDETVESIESIKIDNPIIIKEKKPRTQKQIDAFLKTQENRKANIENKKQEKKIEAAKLLLKEPKIKSKPKIVVDDSSYDEEEIIIVEKRKKLKPKVKRIIIEESSDEEIEESPIKNKEKQFKSQQNKKSIIHVNNTNEPVKNAHKTTMFFV